MTVSERREREREERRNRILDAAQRVFWARGQEQAKMRDIAAEAQLGKGTLYLYFKTKEDLLLGIVVRRQRQMIELFERESEAAGDGLALMRKLLAAYAAHLSTPVEHLKMVMSRWVTGAPPNLESRAGAEMRDNVMRLFGIICDTIKRGQDDGSIRRQVDPPKLAIHLWSSINGALLMRLKMACVSKPNPIFGLAPSIEEHIELLLDALCPANDDVAATSGQSERPAAQAVEEAG